MTQGPQYYLITQPDFSIIYEVNGNISHYFGYKGRLQLSSQEQAFADYIQSIGQRIDTRQAGE